MQVVMNFGCCGPVETFENVTELPSGKLVLNESPKEMEPPVSGEVIFDNGNRFELCTTCYAGAVVDEVCQNKECASHNVEE